jgi:hypothetical protein
LVYRISRLELVSNCDGIWYHVPKANTHHTDIIDQALDPFTECLTPDVARRIAELRADDRTQSRLDVLADKANRGRYRQKSARITTSIWPT